MTIFIFLVGFVIAGSLVSYFFYKDETKKQGVESWGVDDSIVAAGLFLLSGALWPITLLVGVIAFVIHLATRGRHD